MEEGISKLSQYVTANIRLGHSSNQKNLHGSKATLLNTNLQNLQGSRATLLNTWVEGNLIHPKHTVAKITVNCYSRGVFFQGIHFKSLFKLKK